MAFSYSMRPPKDWQQFERATCVLVRSVLGDPNAQMNGRTGQPQAGVDIWGIRQSSKKLVGIQCKHRLSEPVTAQELKDELAKALTFKPPIDEFILATTAPRDAKIQEAARLLTASMGATDWPVSVFVWGWEDIEEQAEPYPDALKAFDPSHSPYIEKAIDALLTHGGAKLAQLNKRARIIIGTGEPFEAVEPAGANRRRIVRVQLRNETDVEISNGRLAIVNLDPANKGVTECELKRDITIGPRSNCFIDVAVYDIGSSQAVPGKFVTLAVPMVGAFFAEAYEFANLPLQGSSFNLRFSRFSEVFDAVFCALRVDAVGGLLLENKGVSSTVRYAAAPISPGFSPASGIRGGLAVLRISVGESGAYVETKGRSTRYLRRAMQIKVENVDLENAALNVRIAILSIKPQVEYVGPWILKEGFAIAGGADEFIPFVSFGEPYSEGSLPNRYENTDTFMEILVDKNRPLLPRDAVHVVSLRATGIGAAACDFVCKVWVDRTDGRLRIAEVSQTAAVE